MPDSETVTEAVTETKSKQPTGSSKRKRKQSIKRNIVLDSDSSCNVGTKSTKIVRTYSKRFKGEKGNSGKDKDKVPSEGNNSDIKIKPCLVDDKNEDLKDQCLKNCYSSEDDGKECKNLGISESSQSSSGKPSCQNCSIHLIKSDLVDSNDKQLRNKKKFSCEICAKDGSAKEFNSVEKHKHHMASVHEIPTEEVKKFECKDCPNSVWFPTKSKFNYHLGAKHPGVIKFICEICTESFKLKANYKTHIKTHNIVVKKKYSCDVCNGSFVNKAGFEAHKRRFPGPHIRQSCTHCGFAFSREKYLKNHRCKTLLLEEAARANSAQQALESNVPKQPDEALKVPEENLELKSTVDEEQINAEKKGTPEMSAEEDLSEKKSPNEAVDPQANKRVVFHRLIPKRNQEQPVYRPVQMETQNISESVVVQELREIDFESGTFIATETEQQFIVRDINGHLLQGNQILQLDVNDVQPGEESQVYLADWNIVAPYVIREKSP